MSTSKGKRCPRCGLVKAAENITYVEGEGRLSAPDTVTVGEDELVGEHVVLATGSYARTLGVEIGGAVMTSDGALSMEEVPERSIILGGGVIGVEFASVLRSFGSEVTIVEALDRLVPMEDPAISKALERAFKKRKIVSRTGVKMESVAQADGVVTLTLEGGETLEADLLLVAVGRGPSSEGLGDEEAGVTLDRGFVQVDERLRTGVGNVRAVGDLVAGAQLAHRGFAHGIFVAEDIADFPDQNIAESLQRIPGITIEANANEEGHLYGSVGAPEISKALKGKNLMVEPDMVKLEHPIKEANTITEVQLGLGYGITNVVDRATATAAELAHELADVHHLVL